MPISKDVLFISTPANAHYFESALAQEGFRVIVKEKFDEAFMEAEKLKPALIVFYLPQYWQSITEFVQKLRRTTGIENTPMVYIGGMVESKDQDIIRNLGVKTLTKGPLPEQEMVRFLVKLVNETRFI